MSAARSSKHREERWRSKEVGGFILLVFGLPLSHLSPGSFLEAVLAGRHQIARDRNGRIFFDRDSTAFRSILNFLREPTELPRPSNVGESRVSFILLLYIFPLVIFFRALSAKPISMALSSSRTHCAFRSGDLMELRISVRWK